MFAIIIPVKVSLKLPPRLSTAAATTALTLALASCLYAPGPAACAEAEIKDVPAAAETKPAQEQELIQDILSAYGGETKMRELDAAPVRASGKITEFSTISKAQNSFDCTMVSKGNKLRIDMNVMGQPLITGYDGVQGWTEQGIQIFPADPATLERIENEIKHSLEHEILSLTSTPAELGKPDTINGTECDVIILNTADKKPVTLYADKKTHLVLRSEFMGIDAEQGIPAKITTDYEDYREILGSQQPFKIVEYTNGQKTTEATQVDTSFVKDLSDDFFSMPAELNIARLAQGPVIIPFDYVYNQILIKARVNDTQDATFIVDTGASQSMLDEKFAQKIGTLEKSNYSITTGSGSMHMNYMVLKSLRLGEVGLENVSIGVTDGSAFAEMRGERPDGLLGANILKRFLVTIDYGQKKIILADPHNVHVPATADVISTKPAMGNLGIVIEGTLDNSLKVPFLVDTGAAFNNSSKTLLQPLVKDKLLPVSKILGLDGQQVDVGAVELHSLKLGTIDVDNPVFSVPSPVEGTAGAGIITSNSLAILGNPLWSQFKLTIDYRHNRIFLERLPEPVALDAIQRKLNHMRAQLHKDNDYDQTRKTCAEFLESDDAKKYKSVSALIHAELAAVLVDQALDTANRELLKNAKKEFETAEQLATASNNAKVQARVYAKLARHIGDLDLAMTAQIKSMAARAIKLAPMDPEVLTSAAMVIRNGGPALAERIVDQALSAEPSNWDALWFRYNLAKQLDEKEQRGLVAAQLRRYYPDVPEVLALEENKQPVPKPLETKGQSVKPASKPAAKPVTKSGAGKPAKTKKRF